MVMQDIGAYQCWSQVPTQAGARCLLMQEPGACLCRSQVQEGMVSKGPCWSILIH